MESVCSPFLQALSAAALFERLTAIVETTTAHLNAIGGAEDVGLGEVPGRKTLFVLPRRPYTRIADRNHGSGYRTRNREPGAVPS